MEKEQSKFGLPKKKLSYESFIGEYVYFRYQDRDYFGKLDSVEGNRIIVSGLATGRVGKKGVEPIIIDGVVFDISSVGQMHESSEEERDNVLKFKFPYNKLISEYVCVLGNGNSFYGILDRMNADGLELKPSLVHKHLEYGSVLRLEEEIPNFVRFESVKNIIPTTKEDLENLIRRSELNYELEVKQTKIRELEVEEKLEELK